MAVSAQAGRLSEAEGELDLRALGRAILSRKWTILIPTFLAAALAIAAVQLATPKYRAESRVLFDGRENSFQRLAVTSVLRWPRALRIWPALRISRGPR